MTGDPFGIGMLGDRALGDRTSIPHVIRTSRKNQKIAIANLKFRISNIDRRIPHPAFAQEPYNSGSKNVGDCADFGAVQKAVKDVRQSVRTYLENMADADLERTRVPPMPLRPEVNLRYLVMRAVAHSYFHIGEVAAKRDRLGHKVGDYPGPLADAM